VVVKVKVDANICVGHGRCFELAPEVFSEDEQGRCHIEREEVGEALEEQARKGAANCPEHAVSVVEG
jgi:ferredoxin